MRISSQETAVSTDKPRAVIPDKDLGNDELNLRQFLSSFFSMERYICIHAHFYQPPRENPWLEAVEIQDSASPYHNWNERITSECYAPNAASRILDGKGRAGGYDCDYEMITGTSMVNGDMVISNGTTIIGNVAAE